MIKKKTPFIFWHIIALILLIILLPRLVSTQGDAMIIPGVGVGVLKLNKRVDDILKKIGPEEVQQWRKSQVQTEEKMMWLSLKELGMSLAFDYKSRRLKKIIVLTKALLVQNTSLRVGSDKKEVIKFMGQPQINKTEEILDYSQHGIKFYIDGKTSTVRTIEVYERLTRQNKTP